MQGSNEQKDHSNLMYDTGQNQYVVDLLTQMPLRGRMRILRTSDYNDHSYVVLLDSGMTAVVDFTDINALDAYPA
jgi:hypothetical protein